MKKTWFLWIAVALLSSSCSRWFNPSVMMQTDDEYPYATMPDSLPPPPYRIQPNDILNFSLFAKGGFRIIDLTSLEKTQNLSLDRNRSLEYLVELDGRVKLPIIGRVHLDSMTIQEAETMLEQQYATFYNEPFVTLKVINKRVTVFPGRGGTAQVVPLPNNNINVIEAIALAGGISSNGKAHKVKLVRGELNDPLVFNLDLSTMEGVKAANLTVQPGDIIYVNPSLDIQDQLLTNTAQVLGIISSFILTLLAIRTLND
ncbi:MAG: polysaccharide biosynthesis/export family protein [Bacteroidota bacterium]